MSKELLKNTKLFDDIKKIYLKNKSEILDIVLFGSIIKGKEIPEDIDILILFKKKIDNSIIQEFKKLGNNLEITGKTYEQIIKTSFLARESFLFEGFSIIYNKKFSENFGFIPIGLFKYNIKSFSKSERMRFYYALYGRKKNEKGILDLFKSNKFSDNVILTPLGDIEKMKEFLENWKINYIYIPLLFPKRILESEVLK